MTGTKLVRIPLRLQKQILAQRKFLMLRVDCPLKVGDVVGFQHPTVTVDGPAWMHVRIVRKRLNEPSRGYITLEYEKVQPCE